MPQKQTKIIIVNANHKKANNEQSKELDPLVQQLNEMKITANLVKQINFNSTINRFQYLQQLLAVEYKGFDDKIKQISERQKQIVNKNIKNMHSQLQKIGNQVLNPKQNAKGLLSNKGQLLELHRKTQIIITTQKQARKYAKLSQGTQFTQLPRYAQCRDENVKIARLESKKQNKIDELDKQAKVIIQFIVLTLSKIFADTVLTKSQVLWELLIQFNHLYCLINLSNQKNIVQFNQLQLERYVITVIKFGLLLMR